MLRNVCGVTIFRQFDTQPRFWETKVAENDLIVLVKPQLFSDLLVLHPEAKVLANFADPNTCCAGNFHGVETSYATSLLSPSLLPWDVPEGLPGILGFVTKLFLNAQQLIVLC